ncbi:alpha/beta fold hydrolase [Sediminitomix flava]|uniref:Pimeloyl-ACP methyl ester carboxylesterase n=1 Tax=Sediminitomix flava TaxID=379075 RepID=A0A315ZGQ2_SEDFL|nr:alpha/beta fold hydrolase [Sediminitomix flava]PWJ44766.1 pimeloyl-ACP methyl ester carboxylesterase [Sediminitomix flava]
MNLFYRESGEGEPLIVLHGLFGSSDNWMPQTKILSEKYRVFLVDQRNHGQSPHADEWNYEVMVEDLKAFIEEYDIKNPNILGHSMGGKVAMLFAVKYPELINKLIVVDISPRYYPVHHHSILAGLHSLDLSEIKSRGQADKALAQYVSELGVRQFLLKNLSRTSDGFEWKINLDVISNNIEEVGKALPEGSSCETPTLFIGGTLSDYILEKDQEEIPTIFSDVRIEMVEGANHWVQAVKPQELITLVTEFIG